MAVNWTRFGGVRVVENESWWEGGGEGRDGGEWEKGRGRRRDGRRGMGKEEKALDWIACKAPRFGLVSHSRRDTCQLSSSDSFVQPKLRLNPTSLG